MINSTIETEEDIQIIKEYTLLPILLDMLARDIEELSLQQNKLIYNLVIFYLKGIESSIHLELKTLRSKMRQQRIQVLDTTMNALGVEVEYKVRGYIHRFKMLRSLVKAELMILLMRLWEAPK
ncbi:hypothetical protein QNH46_15355 [Paenibacillus woosongensis]|uniref:Uncharacterized protein n=1 Tax=Paenibacillus woosongensis TaxID=307580 RepID=A0AA95KSG6_9BACL|nr:hypothetical protein [Paenibacillus woosongensis]WHX47528.1 hypothetical protein QNH46_15355 [Paenibacillus woosongensis]GIP58009.1 hypothetical protein J15TS10_18230 [Paenibacillus woosongensis]